MSLNSYLLMFVIGYLVCSFVTESINPFKSISWDRPKNLKMVGLASWLALALTPLFLDLLNIESFERKVFIGLLFAGSASLLFYYSQLLFKRFSKSKRVRARKSVDDEGTDDGEPMETDPHPRIRRKTVRSSGRFYRPAVVIDASTPDIEARTRRRIKHKRVTGAASITSND